MVMYLRGARTPRAGPPRSRRWADAPVATPVPAPGCVRPRPATAAFRVVPQRAVRCFPSGGAVSCGPMRLPFEPPVEPMLAKASDGLPEGDGWLFEPKWDGFRALVFRDGDEVYIQSRDLKPLDRYFPELAEPLRAKLPERCVLDGEVVIARRRALDFEALLLRIHPAASRVQMLAAETPASFVAWDLLALGDEDLRERAAGGAARAARGGAGAAPQPPVHLTPATRDRALAADWFDRFEGAGLDGVVAKRLEGTYLPGKRAMLKIKHERTADCVVAGFRWHKNGPGTHVGSACCSGLFDDAGHAPPRRHHVVVHVGQARGAASRSWRRCARTRSRATRGASGRSGRPPAPPMRSGQRLPGATQPLEPRQGPVVGAAARRARRRGRLRPPPGRPVPPRDDVPPLAAGQAARGLPLRPAGDDRPVRARADLRDRLRTHASAAARSGPRPPRGRPCGSAGGRPSRRRARRRTGSPSRRAPRPGRAAPAAAAAPRARGSG